MRAAGINVSLAPVADVASVPGAALAARSFSTDFGAAGESVAAAVRGWREGGVASTVKHFPGLGGARVNTDDGSVTIARSAARLRRQDLQPFRRAIEAGVPLVMVGHARYPAIDRSRIASQSKAVIEGLLRDELGFRGVVITDSTEAAAVLAVTPARPGSSAQRAGRCGHRPHDRAAARTSRSTARSSQRPGVTPPSALGFGRLPRACSLFSARSERRGSFKTALPPADTG